MALTRQLRRWISGGLVIALLCMQAAVAAYVCPALSQPSRVDCPEMGAMADPQQPQLCQAHCDNGSQSAKPGLQPDLQANPAALCLCLGRVEPTAAPQLLAAAPGLMAATVPPPGSPPLYLTLQILRN